MNQSEMGASASGTDAWPSLLLHHLHTEWPWAARAVVTAKWVWRHLSSLQWEGLQLGAGTWCQNPAGPGSAPVPIMQSVSCSLHTAEMQLSFFMQLSWRGGVLSPS